MQARPDPSWANLVALILSFALAAPLGAATVSWDGGGDGVSWNDPVNWSANQLPGRGDAVTVPGAFAGVTILHATGSTSIASFDGYRLHLAGGSFTVAGGCTIRSRLEYSGGTLAATPLLSQATLVGSGGASPVTFVAARSSTLEGVLAEGQVLSVRGGALLFNAELLVAANAVNEGTIVLETVNGGYSSVMTVTTGSAFANRGAIVAAVGTGGPRTISGDLLNQGLLQVDAGVGLVQNGSLRNEGTVTVGAGGSVVLSNAAGRTVEQVAGSIGGAGVTLVNLGAFRITGGSIEREIIVRNASIEVGEAVVGEGRVIAQVDCTLVTNDSPTTTVWIQGGGAGFSGNLTAAPGAVNEGSILMESIAGGFTCTLTLPVGEAFLNHGAILVSPGTGGNRTIAGNLDNRGVIEVAPNLGLVQNGSLRNEGMVTVGTGGNLVLSNAAGRTVEQVAGSIGGAGSTLVNLGAFRITGGSIDREITVRNASIEVGEAVVGEGRVVAQVDCTLVTNDSPTTTVWVQGGGAGFSANLTAAPLAVNEGSILMESIAGGFTCTLTVPVGEAFLNHGAILVSPGTGGNRTIAGNLDNRGVIEVAPNLGLVQNGSLRNEGMVTVGTGGNLVLSNAAGRTVEQVAGSIGGAGATLVNQGSFRLLGGAVDREITVRNASIEVGKGVAGEARVVAQVDCTLVTNDSPTTTVWIQGGGAGFSANLAAAAGAVNEGTILMESIAGGFTCTLTVPAGEAFLNRGTLVAGTGTGGVRTITGGGSFRNEGTVFPSVALPLTVGVPFIQTPDGVLRVRFEGTVPGTWSRLQVNAPASIAGTLAIERGPAFSPQPGAGFVCMTGGPISGTFANVGGCGLSAEIVVRATTVTCFVGDLACPGDLDLDGQVSAADLTILLGAWGPCGEPSACVGDLTCDGEVNAADLTILLGAWGACAG